MGSTRLRELLVNVYCYLKIERSKLFFRVYYLEKNPDVFVKKIDPLWHFILHGWKEGRNPNIFFDCNYYLTNNSDVQASMLNPLLHYILYGAKEGRNPSYGFSTQYYTHANPDIGSTNPLYHFLYHGIFEGRAPKV